MSLKDYLSNNNSRRTEVDAAFEVDSIAPSAPVSAPKQARPKQFKRIGRPSGKPAQSAKGKRLTVVANAAPKQGLLAKLKAKASAPKKTPIKNFISKPGVKKAGKIAAIAAAPVAAGAFLAIKNRKAIASGAKNVAKKISFKRK